MGAWRPVARPSGRRDAVLRPKITSRPPCCYLPVLCCFPPLPRTPTPNPDPKTKHFVDTPGTCGVVNFSFGDRLLPVDKPDGQPYGLPTGVTHRTPA